jgi:hypothetical protein
MIRAIMIIEMAGKPATHVKEQLSNYVKTIDEKIKDIQVHTIKISEPEPIKETKDAYTCFAEIDFEAPNFSRITDLIFDYMPSSIEILEPAKVSFDTHQATELLNSLSGRLHRYDEIAKSAKFRIQQLYNLLPKEEQEKLKKEMIKQQTKNTNEQ